MHRCFPLFSEQLTQILSMRFSNLQFKSSYRGSYLGIIFCYVMFLKASFSILIFLAHLKANVSVIHKPLIDLHYN